jgi:hypothetical protein
MEAKLKHLEFIQAVISRTATNSFLFKGWAITIAAGLAASAAVEERQALLVITLVSTVMFWALDGYYLWLERSFRKLYLEVARKADSEIDFSMEIKRSRPVRQWLLTCMGRPHLWFFYGSIIVVEVLGILFMRGK